MLPLGVIRAQWRLLAFGWLMSFGSSLGQTYFISLFGGVMRAELDISHSAYGLCYMVGTFASAAVLPWAGALVDRRPLLRFSLAAIIGLAVSAALFAGVQGLASLALGFFALRFFGQGLMMHAAITTMARYFGSVRGRAVSFATLGHVAGEAVLPIAVVALLGLTHWRGVWLIAAVALLLLVGAAVPALLARPPRTVEPDPVGSASAAKRSVPAVDATLGEVLRDPGLYLRLPVLLAPAAISTALIFHQVHVGVQKGWSLTLIAAGLSAYALGALVMLLASGFLVDRYGARRIVPVCLAPFLLACLVLAASSTPASALVYFGLLGAGSGLTGIVLSAVWAELYGVAHLGAIRAFAASIMVFASGLGPAALGMLIDGGIHIDAVAIGFAIYCVAASAFAALARHGQ